jgi:acid phosphatase type 7
MASGSAQEIWLRSDLAAHTGQCTLAYWHEPRFTSGAEHANNTETAPFWDDLYAAHADVVVNGHNHQYERFARQSPSGAADSAGIREFVVGTGGAGLYSFAAPVANSEVRDSTTHGVLKLTLHAGSYDWSFQPSDGTFTDSGTTGC